MEELWEWGWGRGGSMKNAFIPTKRERRTSSGKSWHRGHSTGRSPAKTRDWAWRGENKYRATWMPQHEHEELMCSQSIWCFSAKPRAQALRPRWTSNVLLKTKLNDFPALILCSTKQTPTAALKEGRSNHGARNKTCPEPFPHLRKWKKRKRRKAYISCN